MNKTETNFDLNLLAQELKASSPHIIFALLHGSAKDGKVKPTSDIDVALFLDVPSDLSILNDAIQAIEKIIPNHTPDVGILNNCEPVYRFEALNGKLLFCKDQEKYLNFFSLTCREYEAQMASYERQKKYRLEYGSKS